MLNKMNKIIDFTREEFRNKFLDTVVENIITYDNKKGKKK